MQESSQTSNNGLMNLTEIKNNCLKKLEKLNLKTEEYLTYLDEELREIEEQELDEDFTEAVEKYKDKPLKENRNGILVAFLLGITPVDPIANDIEPIYFLAGVPDIDIDIIDTLSEYVENRLKEKYGREHVVHICTNIQFTPKNLVKDLTRVMVSTSNPFHRKLDYQEELGLAIEGIDFKDPETLAEGFVKLLDKKDTNKKVLEILDNQEVFDVITKMLPALNGQVRSTGQHPSGVVITPHPVHTIMPTQRVGGKTGSIISAIDGDEISDSGYLKIDVLKTDCTKIIATTVDMVKERKGIELAGGIYKIDLEEHYY